VSVLPDSPDRDERIPSLFLLLFCFSYFRCLNHIYRPLSCSVLPSLFFVPPYVVSQSIFVASVLFVYLAKPCIAFEIPFLPVLCEPDSIVFQLPRGVPSLIRLPSPAIFSPTPCLWFPHRFSLQGRIFLQPRLRFRSYSSRGCLNSKFLLPFRTALLVARPLLRLSQRPCSLRISLPTLFIFWVLEAPPFNSLSPSSPPMSPPSPVSGHMTASFHRALRRPHFVHAPRTSCGFPF